jgi:acyl-CoA thioesterase FadM
MTTLTDRTPTATSSTTSSTTTCTLRPRYEGSNICTWIGFKHVNYLVEEAVLDSVRQRFAPPRELFETYGAGLDIVDIDTRILHALHMDDEVTATVVPGKPVEGRLTFAVTIEVDRPAGRLKAVTSKVAAVLRLDDHHGGEPAAPLPDDLAAVAVTSLGTPERVEVPQEQVDALLDGARIGRGTITTDVPAALRVGDGPAVAWSWRIPYPYCHFTTRMQMSGLLRNIEEVVDLFLAERGVSIRTLLDEQGWIPVVPHSRSTWLAEALMEEELVTVFEVVDVFKDLTYTARVDSYVRRDGAFERVATGVITHGYALIDGRVSWSLVPFDERMLAAVGAR